MESSYNDSLSDEQIKEGILEMRGMMKLSSSFAENAISGGNAECHRYLYELLLKEVAFRKEKRVCNRLKHCGFPARYDEKDFDPSDVYFPEGITYESLTGLQFFKNKQNVFMYGNTGTGKTMLSIILGTLLLKSGAKVIFYKTRELIRLLNELYFKKDIDAWLKVVKKDSDVIILDEFGYTPYDNIGSQLLFELISDVYEKKSIILNTNQKFSNWEGVLQDKDLAMSLAGRILENSLILQFSGKDRRINKNGGQKN